MAHEIHENEYTLYAYGMSLIVSAIQESQTMHL